ncbi:hypothetical protein KCU73_g13417, partial [Aureobasidium melanogenum]
MEYLADMFKACASAEDAESVQGHWAWFVDGVMSVGDSLVQAGLMEAPVSLPKIKQLINKKPKPKPKRPTTRKRTPEELELPDGDEPGDGDFEDEDEDEEEDEDKSEEEFGDEEPKKPKASKKCVLESAIAWPVTPFGKHDQWRSALLRTYARSVTTLAL